MADDDFAGAALVVDHLADLGHRRIAHIEHHETDPDRLAEMPNAIRADGYRQAMRARGLGDEIDIVSTSYTQEGGYLGAQQLLARPRAADRHLRRRRHRRHGRPRRDRRGRPVGCPSDISVAGYDNTTFAAFGPISLTSVDQAGRQIGGNAARLLLDRIADRKQPVGHIKLSPTLVTRRTTAPPSAQSRSPSSS